MAVTEAQLAELEQVIVDRKGALSITFNDQTVTFEKASDAQAWVDMQRQRLAGSTTRYASYDKGV